MLSHYSTSLRVRGILLLHNRGAKPKTAANFICPFSLDNSRMPPKIVAEYAKSGRSSCKKCGGPIAAKAPRLGLVVRDARGFDMPKWHHLQCLRIDSVGAITGYDSFKDVDQEALKKLVDASNNSPEQVIEKGDNSEEVEIEQKIKRTGIEASQTIGVMESGSKKIKLSTSTQKVEFELSFSVSATKDKYKDALLLPKWKAFETIIFLERDDGLHDSRKIAAFDFDGCLAKTSVKRVGADAWSLMYPSIPEQLQKLYSDGYKLVIFTNESNIERWKNKRQVAVDSKIGRLNNFIKKVKVPMQVFIACGFDSNDKGEDPFRKPKPGMWHIMEKYFNSDIPIDMDQSFYVGDAAGRENDHSDADIKFAQAIGLKFYVPEEYFCT